MKVSSLENHWAQVGFSSTPLLEYRVPEGFCWHSMGKKWGINVGDPVTIGIRSDLRIFQWWLDLGSIGYFICVIMLYQSMIIMWLSLCCDYHVIILVSLYHVVSLYDHNPWGSGGLGQTYCHWGAKSLGLREGALGKTNMARMVGLFTKGAFLVLLPWQRQGISKSTTVKIINASGLSRRLIPIWKLEDFPITSTRD